MENELIPSKSSVDLCLLFCLFLLLCSRLYHLPGEARGGRGLGDAAAGRVAGRVSPGDVPPPSSLLLHLCRAAGQTTQVEIPEEQRNIHNLGVCPCVAKL